ncbi:TetR/AcrR family transcriptional regulator [Acetobacter sp.]|uniref:TetR/AcrR family transcriptional regulator n=1 Tax=Acetobacter sp. TaxID=440 RepID=UPI0039E738CB
MTSAKRNTSFLDMLNPCLQGKKRRCGRPTPEDTEQLDQYLLEVAAGLFVQHGYAGTSVDQIARKASASKQTLYRRYASKEDLFKAVITNLTASVLHSIKDTPLKNPLAELKHVMQLLLDLSLQPMALGTYRILISDGYRYPTLAEYAKQNIGGPIDASILRLLKAAEAAGQINPGNADDTTVDLLSGLITGAALESALFGLAPFSTQAERKVFFDRGWTLFVRAVGGECPTPPKTKATPATA